MKTIITRNTNLDVITAARMRITNIFKQADKVYLSVSGGKDSITLSHLVYDLALKGEIDRKKLTVLFIDEEAIYECVERIVMDWREKFMKIGVKFDWYCIEVKHFNCFNRLTQDETFICWDRYAKEKWVRPMPAFAVKDDPYLVPRKDNYQSWGDRKFRDGVLMIGLRTAESVQRLKNIALMDGKTTKQMKMFPIYDWTDNDVWLYIRDNKINFPDAYMFMYQIGVAKNKLRISQFFSIDTAPSLVSMNQYYPDLMEKVLRREPNAYIASYYYDSEMFRRSSTKRRQDEKGVEKDYKAKLIDMFVHFDKHFKTKHEREIATRYKRMVIKNSAILGNKVCKQIYEGLLAGDPKYRTYRSILSNIKATY